MRRGYILKILCLICILLLGGCSNQKEQDIYFKTMDIGIETGLSTFSSSMLMNDGKMLLDAQIGGERHFILIDKKFNIEWMKPVNSGVEEYEIHEACEGNENGHTYHNMIAYKSEKEIICMTVNYIKNSDYVELYVEIYDLDNSKMSKSKKINLPLNGREMYQDFKVDSNGSYYLVQSDGKVEVRDADLAIQQQFIDGYYSEVIFIDNNTMGLVKVGEGTDTVIEHIDTNTFEIKETYQVPCILQHLTYKEGSILGMSGSQFVSYDRKTQELKECIDLADYFEIDNVISTVELEDNYYFTVFYNDDESVELRGFIPTSEEESEKLYRSVISIGTRHQVWGEQLSREINRYHPSIEVNMMHYEGIGGGDWNNLVTTELLGGNGKDMYAELSDWKHLVNNQLAYDMKAFINELIKEKPNDYQKNLLEAITTEAGICVLPENILLPVVVIDKEIASAYNLYEIQEDWTWNEFINILRAIQSEIDDRDLLGDSEAMGIVKSYFIGENLTLDNKDIADEKNKIQEILAIGLELKKLEGKEKIGYFLGGGVEQTELAKKVMNDTVVAIKFVNSYDMYSEVNENYAVLRLPKNNRDWFVGSGIITNNKSQEIDLMMKIVTNLYIQGTNSKENAQFRPYNKYMKEQKANHENGSIYDEELERTIECRKIDQRSLDTMEGAYNSANKWISSSEYSWCESEIEKCLNEEVTPEEAANLIINKAVLYQKE